MRTFPMIRPANPNAPPPTGIPAAGSAAASQRATMNLEIQYRVEQIDTSSPDACEQLAKISKDGNWVAFALTGDQEVKKAWFFRYGPPAQTEAEPATDEAPHVVRND